MDTSGNASYIRQPSAHSLSHLTTKCHRLCLKVSQQQARSVAARVVIYVKSSQQDVIAFVDTVTFSM